MPNSYTTGTVSVTNGNASVTGSGTAFSLNAVVGGFLQVDGDTRQYEIIAAPTATSITLDKPYAGTTGAGKTYRILLTSAQVSTNIQINQNLSTLISQIVNAGPEIQDFLDSPDASSALTALGVSSFIKTLLDDASATAALATLGANNAATLTTGTLPDARLPARLGINSPTSTDLNAITDNGYYSFTSSAANVPAAIFGYLEHINYSSGVHARQTAWQFNAAATWERRLVSGVWTSWERVYWAASDNPVHNDVGQYAFGSRTAASVANTTYAGSGITMPNGGTLTGTWRCLGAAAAGVNTLWQRTV